MPLTTSVTPATIAIALGQDAPDSGAPTEAQWEMWIADALMLVQNRVDSITPAPTLDQDTLDYVIREAVVAQVRKPDDSTQVTVSIDDGSSSRSYRSGTGRVTILGDWWAMLGLAATKGKAFSVDLMPPGAGIGGDGTTYWWA